MLVINPDECIDCGVCEAECPVGAILPDNAFDTDEEAQKWNDMNLKYSLIWPNITSYRPEDVPEDAKEWDGIENKFETEFSEAPGKGD